MSMEIQEMAFEVDNEAASEISKLLADRQLTIATAIATLLYIAANGAARAPIVPNLGDDLDRETYENIDLNARTSVLQLLIGKMLARAYKEQKEQENAPRN